MDLEPGPHSSTKLNQPADTLASDDSSEGEDWEDGMTLVNRFMDVDPRYSLPGSRSSISDAFLRVQCTRKGNRRLYEFS